MQWPISMRARRFTSSLVFICLNAIFPATCITSIRYRRRLCGEGAFDLQGCIRALRAAGWTGPWGVEILSEAFRRLPVREAAAAAFATAAAQLELADDGR